MNIDLTIGWNDLNDQCRAKIKALHKSLKPDRSCVKIKYPSVSDLFVHCRDTDQTSIFSDLSVASRDDVGYSISDNSSQSIYTSARAGIQAATSGTSN